MKANPTDPTTPSCQNTPTKLKSGGELKSANGSLLVVDKAFQNISNPPKYAMPRPKIKSPAKSSTTPCKKSVKIIAVCPTKET